MKKTIKATIFYFLFLTAVALPLTIKAESNFKSQNLYVAKDEIIYGDLITFSESIIIEGKVDGDVIAFGSNVKISGDISGDIIIAGNDLKISGSVDGNIRAVGSEKIEISGHVKKNLNAGGGSIVLTDSAIIDRNAYLAGKNIKICGNVLGKVNALGNNIDLAGEIGKDAFFSLGVKGKLNLAESAKIDGDLTYEAATKNQLTLAETTNVAGSVIQRSIQAKKTLKEKYNIIFVFGKIISLFGMLVLGLVLISIAPKLMRQIIEEGEKNTAISLAWGIIYLMATPFLAILLLFTIIGIPLSIIIIPLYLISLYLSQIIAGIMIGAIVLKKITKNIDQPNLFLAMTLGLVIILTLALIPAIGWAIKLLAINWALGASLIIKKKILSQQK